MTEVFAVVPNPPSELRLVGEFDVAGVATYDAALDAVLEAAAGAAAPSPQLTIDLSGVTFLASAGLACLLRTNGRHPNVRLRGAPPAVLDLLDITGTRGAFRFAADAQDRSA